METCLDRVKTVKMVMLAKTMEISKLAFSHTTKQFFYGPSKSTSAILFPPDDQYYCYYCNRTMVSNWVVVANMMEMAQKAGDLSPQVSMRIL